MAKNEHLWDPAGWKVQAETLAGESSYLANKYTEIAADPDGPKKKLWKYILVGSVATLVMLAVFRPSDLQIWAVIVIVSFSPAWWHWSQMKELATDLVKLMAARAQGWAYSPNTNPQHWRHLKALYPEAFSRGDHSQHVTDEFWGRYAGRFAATPFWIGEFEYTKQHGKQSTTYRSLVFAIQLRKTIQTELIVLPEIPGLRLPRLFSGKDIDFESGEFNRLFRITYHRPEHKKEQKIYQILNPAVMATLIDFRQAVGKFEAIFRNDVLLVSFPSKVLRPQYTSFVRKVEVDPRDIAQITTYLDKILEFSNTVVQQLD